MQHVGQVALAVLALALSAGCSASSPSPPGAAASSSQAAAQTCGTLYTAAHVPVRVEVPPGAVDCTLALRIQADYTRKLSAGLAPGNGGGGPVPVDGWTCEGYPTPQVLQTGRASECHRGGIKFFAVLPAPNASAPAGSAPGGSAPGGSAPGGSAPGTSATP
jgi:hypothetical protein